MNQENSLHADISMLSVGSGLQKRDIAFVSEACVNRPGDKPDMKPGLFWLNGFRSSMFGLKAEALADWASTKGCALTRMDYSGHGASKGRFEDGTISRWLEEVIAVFEQKTKGPQILIGSSMGGWLALLLARKMPERVAGLVLIAPAWNMTAALMADQFDDEIKAEIEKNGFYARPSAYGDGDYIITKALLEDGKNHLLGHEALQPGCPVHILHGRKDPDVSWMHGQALMSLLPLDDVRFTLVRDGDHRLSRPEDIARLFTIIEGLF